MKTTRRRQHDAKLKCKECLKVLSSHAYLALHIKKLHSGTQLEFTCDFEGKTFKSKEYLKMHMERHKNSVLTCLVCMKSYISKHTFRRHLKGHLEKHTCKECGVTFNHKGLLINHTASKHKLDPIFNCFFCTRTFTSKASRNNHHQLAHKNKDELIFKCKQCRTFFETKEDLRIHSFIHFNGKIRACHVCDQIFKTNRLLNIHSHKHLTEKKFECEDCNQKFTFITGLKKHQRLNRCKGIAIAEAKMNEAEVMEIARNQLKEISSKNPKYLERRKRQFSKKDEIEPLLSTHIPLLEDTDTLIQSDYDIPNDNDVESEIEIPPVRRKATRKRTIRLHRRHLTYTCDKCGETVKYRKNIEKHMREKHISFNYQCSICSGTFKSKQKLFNHSLDVHGIKSRIVAEIYSCEFCDKKFDMKSIYEAHKNSHLDERPQVCSICNYSFKSVGNLNRHIQAVHAEGRSQTCEICSKSFKTKLALKNHESTMHADMRVYVNCLECNAIVMEKCLKSHILNMHTETMKNYECEICKKLFKSASLLKRHFEGVHEAVNRGIFYECATCGFTTTRLKNLKSHQLEEHFTGTIHQCECGSKFKTRRLLLIHMANHNSNTSLLCSKCNATFKTRSGLRKHLIKLHPVT